jgi:hypothetical protein
MKQSALLMVVAAATTLGCNPKADTATPEDANKATEEATEDADALDADSDLESDEDAEAEDAADEAEPASDGAEEPADDEASEADE